MLFMCSQGELSTHLQPCGTTVVGRTLLSLKQNVCLYELRKHNCPIKIVIMGGQGHCKFIFISNDEPIEENLYARAIYFSVHFLVM